MTGVCLFVCVVGPGFDSTSPAFLRSWASQACSSNIRYQALFTHSPKHPIHHAFTSLSANELHPDSPLTSSFRTFPTSHSHLPNPFCITSKSSHSRWNHASASHPYISLLTLISFHPSHLITYLLPDRPAAYLLLSTTLMTLASGVVRSSCLWSTSWLLFPSGQQCSHTGVVCPQIQG